MKKSYLYIVILLVVIIVAFVIKFYVNNNKDLNLAPSNGAEDCFCIPTFPQTTGWSPGLGPAPYPGFSSITFNSFTYFYSQLASRNIAILPASSDIDCVNNPICGGTCSFSVSVKMGNGNWGPSQTLTGTCEESILDSKI